jgi:hypothetical protein
MLEIFFIYVICCQITPSALLVFLNMLNSTKDFFEVLSRRCKKTEMISSILSFPHTLHSILKIWTEKMAPTAAYENDKVNLFSRRFYESSTAKCLRQV